MYDMGFENQIKIASISFHSTKFIEPSLIMSNAQRQRLCQMAKNLDKYLANT